ncbi:adenosylcobinamide-GDP ribazoletransferase [Paracidovorax anthurii]|uniref:Adenosylcobinamide-GDP ribazoletransferase n=1 Tax=Paracidovorax anthurii TaxID=78229 RepID=A0A328ZMM4_9BURK|nr:adenosylcobinamide-GDP ribazoletransferase [Paracidovorax anthurii]RAR85962.1 cobalamin-5'-phosphate synthase [Paracidovorax anthurii]
MQALRHFLLAVQFFTRIPVTGRLAAWVGYSPAMLRASAAHFPGVGWIVAAGAVAVYAALHGALGAQPFAALVCAALSTVATVLLTGGFHEDGLADVADGLGGSAQRDRALEIMKDSRIGAFGAMALSLALASKLALLALLGSQGPGVALCALAGAHVASRFWPLLLVRTLPHAGDAATSKSKPLADRISGPALTVAGAWTAPALMLVGGVLGTAVLAASLLAGAVAAGVMRAWFARRLQGFTGDCLGATQQVCEIAFYLGTAVALGPALR